MVPGADRPAFTPFQMGGISWTSFISAIPVDELSAEESAAMLPVQLKNEYYRVLVRDPAVLKARTDVDNAIFHSDSGLARPEKELSALASSMVTGCKVCTSIHARFTSSMSRRKEDVEKLLSKGFIADVGSQWNGIVNLARALAESPPEVTQNDIDELRAIGFAEEEILDSIHAASFFAWANRLMLGLGESVKMAA